MTAVNPYNFTPDAKTCVPEPRQHLADIIRTFLAGDPVAAKKRYFKEFAGSSGSPQMQASDAVAHISTLFESHLLQIHPLQPHLLNGTIQTRKQWDHLQRLVLALESPRALLKLEKRTRWHVLQLAAFLAFAGFCYLLWLTGGAYFLASLCALPVSSVILVFHHRHNRQIDAHFSRQPVENSPAPFASVQDFELAVKESELQLHLFPLSEDVQVKSNPLGDWVLRAIVIFFLQSILMLMVTFPQTDHRLTVVMGR